MKFVSSISGLPISAQSAAFAPTNSADVSAIASAYQVVSATATQLYAGTAYLTSVNGAPVSASRAGNAANASLANSAWYDGTGRFISALPDSAAVSAIASAYAESAASSKQDTLSFSYDDDKISAINGSALAGGGGGVTGDYVEKSALAVTIGDSNSAETTAFAQGSSNTASGCSFAQGASNRTYNYSFAQGIGNSASSNSLAQGNYNGVSSYSFAQGAHNSASSYSFAQGNYNTATNYSLAQGFHVRSNNTAAVFGKYNLHGNGDTATGDSAAFAIGDGTGLGGRHDLMLVTKDGEITMYSSTADTTGTGIMSSIRALSANAGGVDSATVSSIASSYAESAASGKLDASASSSFYTTANESGFLTGVDLSPYQTTADMSSYMPTSMSSDFQQVTGMSSYALSSDVSATVDLVGTQSANWGGSALQLSAGPGVKLEKSGNVLVASTDETVLWSSNVTNGETSATLSGSIFDFESFRIFYRAGERYGAWLSTDVMNRDLSGNSLQLTDWFINTSDYMIMAAGLYTVSNDGLTLSGTHLRHMWFDPSNFTYAGQGTAGVRIYKIVGINRTAGV